MTKTAPAKKSSSAKHDKPITTDKDVKLSKGLLKILNHAAKLTIENEGEEITREDLALELGMNPRSLANNFPKLKEAGVITVTATSITVTEIGMKLADTTGIVSSAPQSNEEHQELLMDKYKLSGSEKKVLMELADGLTKSKEVVAEKLGMQIRSFSNLLTKPKKHGLMEGTGKDIRLSDKMFLKQLGRPSEK